MEPDPSTFSRLDVLSSSMEWTRLLHYRAPFLRSERSDIDDPAFFLAPTGKFDPAAELRETVRMFTTPELAALPHGSLAQPRFCAFPARRDFLARELGEEFRDRLARVACPDFEAWEKGIAATGASLVYASAYPNNPASMFGHTFLRLDRGGEALSKQMDLLSYGVNFSAAIGPGDHPVKYAIWGLVGGYVGRYDLSPYYRKVNEYAFSESRDLWEYRLTLTPGEVSQLVRHIWELYGQGGLHYYFLDENCSYQILTALEAVRPEWKLSEGFLLSAIPVETVRHVARTPGAVSGVVFRPSLKNQMSGAISRLDESERRRLEGVFGGRAGGVGLSSLSPAGLDALALALAYEKEKDVVGAERAAFLRTTLLERSARGTATSARVADAEDRLPDTAHPSSRFSLGFGVETRRRRIELGFAGFRHDLLDRTPSYNLFSEVRVFDLRARHIEGDRLRIDQGDLFAMTSLAPRSLFDGQNSWKVELGWKSLSDLEAAPRAWQISGGYGLGSSPFGPRHLAYLLLHGELARSGAFRDGWGLFPGVDLGVVINPVKDRNFIHLRVVPRWDVLASVSGDRFRPSGEFAASGWLSDASDVRLRIEAQKTESGDRWHRLFVTELATRF